MELREALERGRRRTHDGKYFVPERWLLAFLTENIVSHQLLGIVPPEARKAIVQAILSQAYKVFCILVCLRQENLITDFISHEVLDIKLPLTEQSLEDINVDPKFFDIQWEFISPVFEKRSVVWKLKEKHILPFLEEEKIDEAHGGYCNAYRVVLDPLNQNLSPVDRGAAPVVVFRKEIRSSSDDDGAAIFNDEDRILKMVNSLHSSSIIQVYVSYKHKGVYNFLFPLADMDLAGLMKVPRERSPFTNATTMMKALSGLASALSDVHDFRIRDIGLAFKGCHHDIKPQNILVQGSNFLLADFGLSRFKPDEADSRSVSKAIGDYLAPECRGPAKNRLLVSRKSDIFSFGCVVTELVAYVINGPSEVQKLKTGRRTDDGFWTTQAFYEKGRLKPSIDAWLEEVSSSTQYSNLGLVCELVRKMLQMDPDRRPDARTTEKALRCLYAKFLLDEALEKFKALAGSFQDPDHIIESERLRAWGFATGVYQSRKTWSFAGCSVELLTQKALEVLESTIEELQKASNLGSGDGLSKSGFQGAEVQVIGKDNSCSQQLAQLNQQLYEMLPQNERRTLQRFLFCRIVQRDVEDAIGPLQSVFVVSDSTNGEVSAAAQLKLMYQAAQEEDGHGELKNCLPPSTKVYPTADFGQHSLATYSTDAGTQTEPVLVEWRPVNSPSQEVSMALLRRVDSLAGLYNGEVPLSKIRVLECIGFYIDEKRRAFGVVYRLPANSIIARKAGISFSTQEPVSLFELISSSSTSAGAGITLGHRFEMARAVASSILYCHSLEWLHERLNGHNIVFFPDRGTTVARTRAVPYLIGWNHSRRDKQREFSHGPPSDATLIHYLHPDYREGKPFRRTYDYYSLGLVLLEIGLWRTLGSIVSKYPFDSARILRDKIIEEYLPGLLFSMGELYHTAVKACLTEQLGDRNLEEEDTLTTLQVLVVDKLARCVV